MREKERRDTWKVKRARRYFRAKNIDDGLRGRTHNLNRIEGNNAKDQLNFKRTKPARDDASTPDFIKTPNTDAAAVM